MSGCLFNSMEIHCTCHQLLSRSWSLFRKILLLLESMEVGQSVTPDSQFLYTGYLFRYKALKKRKKERNVCLKAAARIYFLVRVWFSKIQASIFFFFACLIFFPVFYELACQNIDEKTWQTQSNTLNNRLLQLCVLSCILFIQNSSSILHAEQNCDRLKFKTSAAQKKKKKKKKNVKKAHI